MLAALTLATVPTFNRGNRQIATLYGREKGTGEKKVRGLFSREWQVGFSAPVTDSGVCCRLTKRAPVSSTGRFTGVGHCSTLRCSRPTS